MAGWFGLATMTALQIFKVDKWPGDMNLSGSNSTMRFVTKSTMDTYFSCTWAAALIGLLFGVFKCRTLADILFGLSETDAQVGKGRRMDHVCLITFDQCCAINVNVIP